MDRKERKEKLDKIFERIAGLMLIADGPEGMVKYASALREIQWAIREEETREMPRPVNGAEEV